MKVQVILRPAVAGAIFASFSKRRVRVLFEFKQSVKFSMVCDIFPSTIAKHTPGPN